MKLKKIASLMLAGIMAVSMLTACDTTSNTPVVPDGDGDVTTTPVNDMTSAFQLGLSDKAEMKVNMSYSEDLQDDLAFAAGEVGYATIFDFCTAIRTAGTGILNLGSGVRTVANFDQNGNVYVADVNNGQWNVLTTNNFAGDLSVAAADMSALNVADAFNALIPTYNEMKDDTVTMLFAVDGFIGVDNAVAQVADVIAWEISELKIDDDNSADINCGPDATHLHYEYTGAVSVTNRTLPDNHGMGLNIIAVQITRTAKA